MKISLIKPVFAQIINPVLDNAESISQNPANYVNNIIQVVINIFLIVAVVYFIWHIVMSAYHMISSNGDPKKYEEATKAILNAFVGIIIVFSIFAILKFAGAIFGISSLKDLTLTWPSLSK